MMHSVADVGSSVPAFLAKLWKLVEDQDTNDLICWNDGGNGFVIHNQAQFCRELLPLYYKHNNMASFVRQLNMYGFHKKVSVDSGGLKLDKDEMEFAHPCFLRGQPYLLENIKRKIAEPGRGTGKAPEVINRVLGDVKQMKGRQETLDSRLSAMKRENEALWRELALLRQKHLKQQQIVNKLIQFLLTVVQSPGARLGIKRRLPPLMLNDKEHHHHHHHHHKHHKHHRASDASASTSGAMHLSSDEARKLDELMSGPTIHELDSNGEYILPDQPGEEHSEGSAGVVTTPPPLSVSPTSPGPLSAASPVLDTDSRSSLGGGLDQNVGQAAPQQEDVFLEDASTSSSTAQAFGKAGSSSDVALLNNGGAGGSVDETSQACISRDEFDNHLESMQTDLEGLKELLSKETCSLDANTLLSLFTDDPMSLGMGLPGQEEKEDDSMGSELIAYNPSLFDLMDEPVTPAGEPPAPLFTGEDDTFLGSAQNLLSESDLSTPHPKLESPEFPSLSPKKRRK